MKHMKTYEIFGFNFNKKIPYEKKEKIDFIISYMRIALTFDPQGMDISSSYDEKSLRDYFNNMPEKEFEETYTKYHDICKDALELYDKAKK